MKTYLIFKTDVWHTHASRELIAVAIDRNPIDLIRTHSNDSTPISEDDVNSLIRLSQTQGYKGEGEYLFEEVEPNLLL